MNLFNWMDSLVAAASSPNQVYEAVTPQHVKDFAHLCIEHHLPLWMVQNLWEHNGHWYESPYAEFHEGFNGDGTQLPFENFECGPVHEGRYLAAVEAAEWDWCDTGLVAIRSAAHPEKMLSVQSAAADLSGGTVQSWLEGLSSKHRNEAKKAMQLDASVEVVAAGDITDEDITWMLEETAFRHRHHDQLHAMGLILWSVARGCTFLFLREGDKRTSVIGVSIQPQLSWATLACSVKGRKSSPSYTTNRLLIGAIELLVAQGIRTFDTTERSWMFEQSTSPYKRKIANSEITKYCAGSVRSTSVPPGFTPPYYVRDLKEWQVAV